jgi:hypothetical protein
LHGRLNFVESLHLSLLGFLDLCPRALTSVQDDEKDVACWVGTVGLKGREEGLFKEVSPQATIETLYPKG